MVEQRPHSTFTGEQLAKETTQLWFSVAANTCRPLCHADWEKLWPSQMSHLCSIWWQCDGECNQWGAAEVHDLSNWQVCSIM